MNPDELKKEAVALLNTGKGHEDVILFLRQKQCSKALSVVVLASALNCDMGEAKRIVHFSKTWADTIDSHEKLHERIERALKKERD